MAGWQYVRLEEKDFLARTAKKELAFGQHWLKRNFNPWNVMSSDCLVRAVSAAIMMKYVDVCRHLGVRVLDGVGQDERVTLSDFLKTDLAQYFDKAVGIRRDDCTLDQFCEFAWAESPGQVFVAFVKYRSANEGASSRKADHAVYVCSDFDRPYFIDNSDSGNSYVYAAIQVRKQVPRRSSERLTVEGFRKIQALDGLKRQKVVDILDYVSRKFEGLAEKDCA